MREAVVLRAARGAGRGPLGPQKFTTLQPRQRPQPTGLHSEAGPAGPSTVAPSGTPHLPAPSPQPQMALTRRGPSTGVPRHVRRSL